MTTLQERCRIAEQCLPEAPYRAMLTKLHDDMLAALAQQGKQQPVAYITDTEQGPMVWTPEMYDEACTYCDDGEFPIPLYTVALRPTSGDYAQGYAEGFNDACKPAPQAQEPAEWRTEAVKWIRRKAEDQRATNEQNPRHAEAYPSWGERVRQWHWLADDLELEQNSPPFGLEPYQEPAPQPAQGVPEVGFGNIPTKFLANGTRFKLSFDTRGRVSSLWNFMDELDGRWVALVAAEDDCHLQSAQPVAQPLSDDQIEDIGFEMLPEAQRKDFIEFARAIEAAHGIREVK